MHFLHLELERNEYLNSIVSGVSQNTVSNKAKMGLILDLNPIWLYAFRLDDAGLNTEYYWPVDHMLQWNQLFFGWPGLNSGTRLPELDRKFAIVDDFTSRISGQSMDIELQPFLLRIIARPNPYMDDSEEFEFQRRQLVSYAREIPIFAVVETHPKPQLIATPGSRVISSSGIEGTLGGYLRDQKSGTVFAVTCGHVISGAATLQSGQQIGNAIHWAEPVPLPAGTPCHTGCGAVTELDIALIRTNVTANNQASSIARIVGNGQIVEMEGATSGPRTYEVGGAVVEYEIGGACWHKLIQLHAPLAGILPAPAQVAMTGMPKDGDSGAWIIRNNTEWAGMIVASNTLFGFALPASEILDKSNTRFQTDLSLA